MNRIFCSLFDKNVWEEVIRRFNELFQPEWVATSSTAEFLKSLGCRVLSLEQIGVKAQYLGGKVKSLHPFVYAGVMANKDVVSEMTELREAGIEPFDGVMVDIYRVKPDAEFDISQVDIGGPSVLRAASKNYSHCLPLCHPQTTLRLINDFQPSKGQTMAQWVATIPVSEKKKCATDVFAMMSDVNQSIAFALSSQNSTAALTYGDNPGERAWLCAHPIWRFQHRIETLDLTSDSGRRHPQDMKFSWNNVMDIHQALSLFRWIQAPKKVAIMKHHHTCGVGYDAADVSRAFEKAHACDPLSAFGGVVVMSHCPGQEFISDLKGKFIDLLVIPNDSPEFFNPLIVSRPKQRVIALPFSDISFDVFDFQHHSTVFGEVVLEKWKSLAHALDEKNWQVIEGRLKLTPQSIPILKNAYAMAAHLHSNAIVVADSRGSLGIGVGFVNRVDAIRHAVKAASQHQPEGPMVLASDGFMPFADNVDATAGIPLDFIIQPGGSKNDADVIRACQGAGVTLVLTGSRVFFHGI